MYDYPDIDPRDQQEALDRELAADRDREKANTIIASRERRSAAIEDYTEAREYELGFTGDLADFDHNRFSDAKSELGMALHDSRRFDLENGYVINDALGSLTFDDRDRIIEREDFSDEQVLENLAKWRKELEISRGHIENVEREERDRLDSRKDLEKEADQKRDRERDEKRDRERDAAAKQKIEQKEERALRDDRAEQQAMRETEREERLEREADRDKPLERDASTEERISSRGASARPTEIGEGLRRNLLDGGIQSAVAEKMRASGVKETVEHPHPVPYDSAIVKETPVRAINRSHSEWAYNYEAHVDPETKHMTYERDGVEKIRDRGPDIQVADDRKSISDGISLAKEQGSQIIDVRAVDPEKRIMIMSEAYRQNVRVNIPDKAVMAEYQAAVVAIERERYAERHAIRSQEKDRDQGMAIGD